jgi:peptide/nickel transport system ATP-binding protein
VGEVGMSDPGVQTAPLLEVRELRVSYRGSGGPVPAVRGASLRVARGEVVALVGESGSGKSSLGHAVVGLLAENGRIESGSVRLAGQELVGLRESRMRAVRGARIGLIPQDPAISLNPVKKIGEQVGEVLRTHHLADRRQVPCRVAAILARAGLPDPELTARQYPHVLSGGMRQRVLIAIALAAEPELIIADEPTSALDVTVQRRILDELRGHIQQTGASVLLITHDLGVAADRADRVAVMSAGRIVEQGGTGQVLSAPTQPYTARLVASVPGMHDSALVGAAPESSGPPVAEAVHLVKEFGLPRRGRVLRAVDDVSFAVARAETLALVGESGSGKSTTARLLLRLVAPTSGRVRYAGTDVTSARGRAWRELRRRAQLVYQNPYSSLDPRYTVEEIIAEPLRAFRVGSRGDRARRAAVLLDQVALPSAMLARRPAELSGGQRQRVAIARALALSPELVVCDEPVSALDVSVQAQVLELLVELQRDAGLSYLFISHDLAVVRQVAHRIGVLRAGRLVELRPTRELFERPSADYTRELLGSIAGRRYASEPA